MLDILLAVFISLFALFTIFYCIALVQGIYNSVDIAYGLGFILAACVSLIFSNEIFVHRKIIITILIILWGIRIGYFLHKRGYGKDEITNEDKRFKIFRDKWGSSAKWKGYIFLFIPQIFFVMIVGFPLMVTNYYAIGDLLITDYIGILIFIIGFLFETISDYQLLIFKKNPANKGKIMTNGLWKFSQHPNYFGEITIWIGFSIIALFSFPFELWNILAIISPIFIALSLLRVSGITLLNKRFSDSEDYSEYKIKTSVLIPWFPKKIGENE